MGEIMCVKIESYCGIECSSCELKESSCCGTCVKTKGVTFYQKDGAVCPIAQCAISKNRRFCGECAEFPCELLTRFAFDKEHGDNEFVPKATALFIKKHGKDAYTRALKNAVAGGVSYPKDFYQTGSVEAALEKLERFL